MELIDLKKLFSYIKNILSINNYLSNNVSITKLKGKIAFQLICAASFLILSITNIIQKSYAMLIFTSIGTLINLIFAIISYKTKNQKICTYSLIIVCTIAFSFFVIYGGNEGFAALWITLMPTFAMAIFDLFIGFISNAFAFIFLIVVFWTPIHNYLPYLYNKQFCVRFPLFFFISLVLGLSTSLFLQASQYRAETRLLQLKKISEVAEKLSKSDYLTGLANRRHVYDTLEKDNKYHKSTIIMGDIDDFKGINDEFGHKCGDIVLTTIAKYITNNLPETFIKSRWGGEEFLIVCNDPLDEVYKKVEELRLAISNHTFNFNDNIVKVTMTFGLSECVDFYDFDNAISRADNNLYIGKKTTRNTTIK